MKQEISVLALVKGKERYVFIYNDENRSEMMRKMTQYASDPDLNFSWYDAAVLSQKIRREKQKERLARRQDTPLPTDYEF